MEKIRKKACGNVASEEETGHARHRKSEDDHRRNDCAWLAYVKDRRKVWLSPEQFQINSKSLRKF